MKKIVLSIVAITMFAGSAVAQEITGDAKLACEALLCLSSPTRPSECAPALKKYFSITNLLLSTSKISFEQTAKATTTKINKNGKLYKYKVIMFISLIL